MLSATWRATPVLMVLVLVLTAAHESHAQLGGSGSRGGMGGGGGAPPGGGQAKKQRYVPPKFAPSGPRINVQEVRLKGQHSVPESRIRAKLQTRAGRAFDPNTVQADVRKLLNSGLCYDVRTYREETPKGVIITFELFEQPLIRYVKFSGTKVRESTLLKEAEIDVGQPLSRFRVEEAKRKLEEYFKSRGNSHVVVDIQEGDQREDKGVIFLVNEGPRQRIRWTKFEGNDIASDSRLRTQIDSKPGILWLFKGKVDKDVIDEDVDKLTSYYRSLGYFKATVTKELNFDDQEEWLTLTFKINEGPRYVIRNVRVEGNDVYDEEQLLGTTEMRPGDFFDLMKMNVDVRNLKDVYGANGYIKANVIASPQFYEEPGQLDLVYKVDEGGRYRVGNIEVNIAGEHPHTRHTVILNRIDMREGDYIDIRKLRASERRIGSSQLFETGGMSGPQINVIPRQSGTQIARPPSNSAYR